MFENYSDKQLIENYTRLIEELKKRKIIRSKNVVGDLGENLAIAHYNKTDDLPNLKFALSGAPNVDALSKKKNLSTKKNDEYSIKSTTTKTTGVFYGLPQRGETEIKKLFDYVIIVMLGKEYELIRINELTWYEFLKYKKWHSRMKAWNLTINQNLLQNTKTVFPC